MLANPGIYVHFPWCVRKCPYCDFNSHPLRTDADFDDYLAALLIDWQAQAKQIPTQCRFSSVFLGGGTPSLFSPAQIERVLNTLPLSPGAEVTMEANPGTTEHADFSGYQRGGVNRLSIGAQSFDDRALQRLGRIHNAAETALAFNNARQGGFDNINLDLMWGLPEQTVDAAVADVQAAIDLAPEHISWYQLTIEAKTEFAKRTPLLPVEDILGDIESLGLELLADAGYVRYEVSAFAKPHRRCRHNCNYWTFGDYVGIGAGAHGKISQGQKANLTISRTRKSSQPRLYQAQPGTTVEVPIEPTSLNVEFMMNALRLVDGVSWDTFCKRTGLTQSSISTTWTKLVNDRLVKANRCAPTPLGTRYLDSVVSAFIAD